MSTEIKLTAQQVICWKRRSALADWIHIQPIKTGPGYK